MEEFAPAESPASSEAQNHKIQVLEQGLLAMQGQNQTIQEQLAQLTGFLRNSQTQSTPSVTPNEGEVLAPLAPAQKNTSSRPKPVLPNTPKFSGDRKSYEVWRTQITDKIRVDGASIGSPANQFAYVNSRLEGAAAQMCLTFASLTAWTDEATPETFIGYLDRSYSDPNKKLRATGRLRTMKQGDASFSAFLPRFERALAEAGGSSWPDEAKIAFMEGTLNDETRNALIGQDLPQHYTEYITKILNIDGQLQAVRKPRRTYRTNNPSDTMDWEPTQATRIAAAQRNPLGKLTPEERTRCQALGLCFRCRQKGHAARDCMTEFTPPKTTTTERTRVKKTQVVEELGSEKEESVPSSPISSN